MHDIDLFEAMRTCRTVRRLRPDPVPDELLRKVLTAATWAPSGGNRQPWRFLIVRDPQLKRSLGELYLPVWRSFSQVYAAHLATLSPESRVRQERMIRSADHLAEHFHEVPVIVVVCVHIPDLAITDAGLDRPSVVGGASIYPAVQNLILACRAVGLGAALTTLLCHKEPEVRALLGIPEGWATCAHLPLGYPAGKAHGAGGHGPVHRKPVERVTFLDRWDRPLFP
jgi:nitroreductase